jgi:hypothetical protein
VTRGVRIARRITHSTGDSPCPNSRPLTLLTH